MGLRHTLVFARGETRFGGDSALASSLVDTALEGAVIPGVVDTVNNTGQPVDLIILRNASGGRLRPKELIYTSASPGGMHRKAKGHSGFVSGTFAIAVDDAYASSIIAKDLFYGVLSGPVQIKTTRTGTAFTQGAVITSDNRGRVTPRTAVGQDNLGVIDRAVSNAVSSKTVLCYLRAGYKVGTGA